MKTWIKGGLWGLIVFVIIFIILSLVNTGKVSVSDAFGMKDPVGILNYILVIIFIIIGSLIGLIVGKIKSKGKKK